MVENVGLLICVPIWIISVLLLGASITAGLFVLHVAVVPLIFKYSKSFRRHLVFANFENVQKAAHQAIHIDLEVVLISLIIVSAFVVQIVQWPFYIDYDDPASCGIEGGRNLNIKYHSKIDNCKIRLGIWHILPKTVYERLKGSFEECVDKEELSRLLDGELATSLKPIMMYCHGNSNSRCASHRIALYKFFQKMDFHTIAFDYRGYGDSSNQQPSEDGVVEDSLVVYEWLADTINKRPQGQGPPVFVWGHSLGTGISSNLLGNLKELSANILERKDPLPQPNGLILEAPFNTLADEVAHHPLAILVRWLPYFKWAFVSPFESAREHTFCSERHLRRQPRLPVLILHAEDDVIVPFVVGVKLFRALKASRNENDATIKFHAYDKSQGLGHKGICRANDLHEVVGEFVTNHR